jgi:hypothetical protein
LKAATAQTIVSSDIQADGRAIRAIIMKRRPKGFESSISVKAWYQDTQNPKSGSLMTGLALNGRNRKPSFARSQTFAGSCASSRLSVEHIVFLTDIRLITASTFFPTAEHCLRDTTSASCQIVSLAGGIRPDPIRSISMSMGFALAVLFASSLNSRRCSANASGLAPIRFFSRPMAFLDTSRSPLQAHAGLNCLWVSAATLVQIVHKRAAPIIGPDGKWAARCSDQPQAGFVTLLLDRDDPIYDIPFKKARLWREKAKQGDIYREKMVDDPEARIEVFYEGLLVKDLTSSPHAGGQSQACAARP